MYTYDDNHNMLSSGVEETHYNKQNQVTKVNNMDRSMIKIFCCICRDSACFNYAETSPEALFSGKTPLKFYIFYK